MHQALFLNNQRKITYSNSCILFSLLISMCSIFSNFFLNLNIHLKLYAILFPWVQLLFRLGLQAFAHHCPQTIPHHRVRHLILVKFIQVDGVYTRTDGNYKLTQNGHDKSSTCFTNALQHLYAVIWMQLKTWYTVEALPGMTVGFSGFLNGYLGSMHEEFTQNLCIPLN